MDEQRINEMAFHLLEKQVGLKEMEPKEIAEMLAEIKSVLQKSFLGVVSTETEGENIPISSSYESVEEMRKRAKKSIGKNYIECLECGVKFKIINKIHLKHHGLTVEEYLKKWGLPKGTKLISKNMQNSRKEKMLDIKLWERSMYYAKKLEKDKLNAKNTEKVESLNASKKNETT